MEIDSQAVLTQVMREEAVTDLLLDAGYQNVYSLKLNDIGSVLDNVVKYLVLGKCRYYALTIYINSVINNCHSNFGVWYTIFVLKVSVGLQAMGHVSLVNSV